MPETTPEYDFSPIDPSERNIFGHMPNRPKGGGDPVTIMLGSKIGVPLFFFALWVLYPVSGCIAFATLWLADLFFRLLFPGWIALFLALPPALVVLWLMCRWDCAMGENKTYWLVRHVFRLCTIMGVMFYVLARDRYPHPTFGQVISNALFTPEILVVSLLILAFLHWIMVGPHGTIKSFWHDGLELLRLRPKGLEATGIITRRRPETFAEVQERLRRR